MRGNKSLTYTLGLNGLVILSALSLSSSLVSADNTDIIDSIQLTVPIACTMSGTGTVHAATLNPGTYSGASGSEYQNGIGKTTLTAICNDDNGFSIYAIGYTGNSYDSANHTKLVGNTTNLTIDTKVYASGDTASNWSMKLTKVTDSTVSYNPANLSIQNSFDSWHIIPANQTKVAEYHANTGSSSTDTTLGVKLETTYAAFIASNQSADIYEGQVKYTLVHPYNEEAMQPQPAIAGKIVYHKNATTAIGTMANQNATDGNNVMLYPSNFSRTGYGFAGWSDVFDYETNPNAHFYGPMETITVPSGTTSSGLSLYAVWIKSTGSMQDASKINTLCGTGTGSLTAASFTGNPEDQSDWTITADLSSVTALTDQRDNQTYAIAKLSDGKCWMIENLRLDSQYTTSAANIALAQGYGASETYGNFIGLADPESTNFSNGSTTANSLYSTDGADNTINIDTTYASLRFPRYNNDNTASRASNTTNSQNIYSYGNYYTWAAVIADTSNYTTGTHNTTSICPSGWRIPTGHNSSGSVSGEYGILSNSLGGYKNANDVAQPMSGSTTPTGTIITQRFRHFPNNFVFSGHFSGDSASIRGSGGQYYSSTVYNVNTAYYLTLSGDVYPATAIWHHKNIAKTVRCISSATQP